MKKNLLWKTDSFSGNQEIPSILWYSKVRYLTQNSPQLVPILRQINPFYTLSISFLNLMFLWLASWIDHTKLPTWCTEYYLFVKYYYSPLHVSSIKNSSSGGHSCTQAAYGTVTLYKSPSVLLICSYRENSL